jgi:hypothetical protein
MPKFEPERTYEKSVFVSLGRFLFFLNLFGQCVEPFEVKGDTHEIPFAFHCVQSA